MVAAPLLKPAAALAAPIGDTAVLVFALQAEQLIVYAYELAAASRVISPRVEPVVNQFLGQEREHADALAVNIERLSGPLPTPPANLAAFEAGLRALQVDRSTTSLHNERDHLRFLVMVEIALARAYHFAIEQLSDDKLIQTSAQIMANEGQHATILRELIAPGDVKRAVPSASVGSGT